MFSKHLSGGNAMNSYFFTQSQRLLLTTIFALLVISAPAQAQTLMLRQPALSESYLAFVYGGDIWIADADGDNPRRLTSHPATESNPKFSPDGEWLAFSATYESNTDVYVISVEGGQARRLTWHPQADTVNG
jgi:tricorn protease